MVTYLFNLYYIVCLRVLPCIILIKYIFQYSLCWKDNFLWFFSESDPSLFVETLLSGAGLFSTVLQPSANLGWIVRCSYMFGVRRIVILYYHLSVFRFYTIILSISWWVVSFLLLRFFTVFLDSDCKYIGRPITVSNPQKANISNDPLPVT